MALKKLEGDTQFSVVLVDRSFKGSETTALDVDPTTGAVAMPSGISSAFKLGRKSSKSGAANMNVSASDCIVLISGINAARVLNLPAAATAKGLVLIVKDADGSATGVNTVTADAAGTETIDGATTKVIINAAFGSARLYCDGTKWYTI